MRRALVLALVLSLAGCASKAVSGTSPSRPAGSAPSRASAPPTGSARGQTAPDFTLTSLDGETVHLSALKGQPVFLDFWATWCPPCRDSLPETAKLSREYRDAGLKVYAVNVGEKPDIVARYLAAAKIEVPVLLDIDEQASKGYQFDGLPSFFVLDQDHVIQLRLTGWGSRGPGIIRQALKAMGVEPKS